MTYRGPCGNRVSRRRRGSVGPAKNGMAWSSGSLIAIILAILVVALAVAYGVNG